MKPNQDKPEESYRCAECRNVKYRLKPSKRKVCPACMKKYERGNQDSQDELDQFRKLTKMVNQNERTTEFVMSPVGGEGSSQVLFVKAYIQGKEYLSLATPADVQKAVTEAIKRKEGK